MRLRLHELVIHCKHGQEVLSFTDFNYFHGRMGAGKSTIARLIDFCLGGALVYTPALQSEFVAATIDITIAANRVLLTRNSGESHVRAQWTHADEPIDVLIPAREADGEVLPNTGVENVSDLFFHLAGIEPPMVRRSKARDDSQLVRLSLRDLFWYCYLDQDSMDSSFFRLDDSNHNVRLKSLDVLGLIVGFHQQLISELQVKLEGIRTERQRLETAAEAIKRELTEEQLASPLEIERAIERARQQQIAINEQLAQVRAGIKEVSTHATESLRALCRELATELEEIDTSILEIEETLRNDKTHRNTLLNLAVRQRRAHGAKEALSGVEFKHCPQCYQQLPQRDDGMCLLCGQAHLAIPSTPIDDSALEADMRSRTDELAAKVKLQESALGRLRRQRAEIAEEKRLRDLELNKASAQYDSAYLSQTLEREKHVARLGQRILDLRTMLKLANRVGEMEAEARRLLEEEAALKAEIRAAKEQAERDTTNIDRLKELFLGCLLRAKMPGFFPDDVVEMRPPWFLPEVIGKDSGDFALTSFETLGSGGKKTLFKCCFALAIHLLAREQKAPIPDFLIIDSPMKNISERENREQFAGFNQMLYELAVRDLRGTQFIVIDKEYEPPALELDIGFKERYMTPDDQDAPPLISGYRGK